MKTPKVRLSTVVLFVMLALAAAYFSYEIVFVLPRVAGIEALILNSVLMTAEILSAIFGLYIYYSLFCTFEWSRTRYDGLTKFPFVTVQVPTYNEPFSVAEKTLRGCMSQDYPQSRREIIVADDSTDAVKMRQLETFCKKNGIKFIHRDNRRAFKAGALNESNRYARGELFAILDADDTPEPTFLSHSVEALLEDDKIAFVQARNSERNFGENAVTKLSGMIRGILFSSIMKSKDNRDLAVFCGSGGVVRRSVLEKLGGWPEETLTEDTDFTTKAFSHKFVSAYINPVECRGLLPTSYSGFQRQSFRWAKGTTQTLFLRWRMILKIPSIWRKIEHFLSCMSYFIGPMLLAFNVILITHLLTGIQLFHMYDPMFLWVFGIFLALSSFFASLHTQLNEGRRFSLGQILIYVLASHSLSVNFTKAILSAALKRKSEFYRTPRMKTAVRNRFSALRKFWIETLLGAVSLVAAAITITNPAYMVQALWTIFFGIGFLMAPIFALRYG